jgi:hypothetical protein
MMAAGCSNLLPTVRLNLPNEIQTFNKKELKQPIWCWLCKVRVKLTQMSDPTRHFICGKEPGRQSE